MTRKSFILINPSNSLFGGFFIPLIRCSQSNMATAPTENAPKLSKSILQRETHKDLTNLISKPLSFHCKSMGEGREGVFNRYLICK